MGTLQGQETWLGMDVKRNNSHVRKSLGNQRGSSAAAVTLCTTCAYSFLLAIAM